MMGLPLMLRVADRRCVVVGGGGVALRRSKALLNASAQVYVISPVIDPAFAALPVRDIQKRPYQTGDLVGAFLAVAATNNPMVNQQVSDDAIPLHVLVNRADLPDAGDLTIPAHTQLGPLSLAVHTGGVSAAAGARILEELTDALDPAWPRLLEIVAPYRQAIQCQIVDSALRQKRLAALTDDVSMTILKTQGTQALLNHCQALAQPPIRESEPAVGR